MSAPAEPAAGFWQRVKTRARAIEDVTYEADIKAVSNPAAKKWFWRGMLVVAGILVLHFLFLLLWLWRDSLAISVSEAYNMRLMHYYLAQWNTFGLPGLLHAPATPMPLPPFYFWSMMPVLNLFPHNPALGVLLANWVYLVVIGVSAYIIAKFERMDSCGWTGAAFATCMPFVLSSMRHVSPDIAVMAFSLAAMAAYVQSNGFMNYAWTLVYIACVSCGLLSGWQFLLFFPALVFLTSTAAKNWLVYGRSFAALLVPLLLLAVWISPNMSAIANGMVGGEPWAITKTGLSLSFAGMLWWPFWTGMNGMTLLFFLPSMATLFLLMEAELAPYLRRRELYYWLVLSFFTVALLPLKSENYILPALVMLGPIAGIAMPERLRRPAVTILMLLALGNQAGCASPKTIKLAGKRITVFGGEQPRRKIFNADALAVSAAGVVTDKNSVTTMLLLPGDLSISAQELEVRVRAFNLPKVNILSDGEYFLLCPDVVILAQGKVLDYHFLRALGSPSDPGSVFSLLYRPGGVADIGEGRKAFFYFKKIQPVPFYPGSEFRFDRLEFHDIIMENVRLNLGPYDAATGTYPRCAAVIGHMVWHTASFYGLKLNMTGFSFYVPDPVRRNRMLITDLSSLHVASGLTTGDNVTTLMAVLMTGFSNVLADFTQEGIKVSARRFFIDWHLLYEPVLTENPVGWQLRPLSTSLYVFKIPRFMTMSTALNFQPAEGRMLPFTVTAGPVTFTGSEMLLGRPRADTEASLRNGEMELTVEEPAR